MHLVLGAPDPVAVRLIHLLVERGERVAALVAPEESLSLPEGVRVVPGDAASIDWGVSGTVYRQLLLDIRRVYLADTRARPAMGVEKSRTVRQAAEVVEFVRAGGAKEGVGFLSSLLVFGDASSPVSESDLYVAQSFSDEHEESLAVAEKIVHGLGGVGPLAIVRIAPIVGDEEKGELIEGSPLARLLHEIERANPDKNYHFSDLSVRWETVDRAARALLEVQPEKVPVVVHLVDEAPLTDRQLVVWIAARCGSKIQESAPGVRPWSSWARPTYPGGRALSGWALAFSRQEAQTRIPHLLDRDDIVTLERLLPGGLPTDD